MTEVETSSSHAAAGEEPFDAPARLDPAAAEIDALIVNLDGYE